MSSFGGTTTANGPSSSSTTEQAKEQAKRRRRSGRAAGQAHASATRSTSARPQAGERVGSTAQDIRSVSEELRKQGKDQPAKLAEQAAQRAESLGDYLKRSDGDTILRDVEDFGRRQPWAVIAGGIALGFAASRFLKASSTRRYAEHATPRSLDRRRADEPHRPDGRADADRRAVPTAGTAARPLRRAARGSTAATRRPTTVSGRCDHGAHDPVRRRRTTIRASAASASSSRTWRARPRRWFVRRSSSRRPRSPQKGKLAGKGAGMLAGAAVTALLGLGALTALLIIALDGFLPLWLAALIVTLLWLAVAGVLAMAGKKALQAATPPAPQTVETVKEDIQWAKTQDRIRAEIEQTRAEMGETVDALGYKTDVKARAKDSIQTDRIVVGQGPRRRRARRTRERGQAPGAAREERRARRTRSGSPSARSRSASSPAC